MSIEFNHTLVQSRDARASAEFMAQILGLSQPTEYGPFQVVKTANGVNVDFMQSDDEITTQHYAFLVSEAEFDEVFDRIQSLKMNFWADPAKKRENEINHNDGGRGVYFDDLNGHRLEVITKPYGTGDTVKIERNVYLSASPERVWQRIGSFGAIADWHPLLASVECAGNHMGARRTATGEDGSRQVERLVSYLDSVRPERRIQYGYVMDESALPVADYEAELTVEADGRGSRVHWRTSFKDRSSEGNAEETVDGFIRAGLDALPKFMKQE